MPLHPAYAQVSALLTAVFILIAGNGLSNTLIPLSATAAQFPPLSIGVIASGVFRRHVHRMHRGAAHLARADTSGRSPRSSRSRP